MMIRYFGWAVVVAALTAIGCGPSEKIELYDVPKEVAPSVASAAKETGPATDRMLAAVLPDGARAWFFKVAGPVAEMDAVAADVEEFFASIKPAPGKPHPDWTLRANWQERAGSEMRAATLLVPVGGKSLELTVIGLPWSGAPGELLSNVNRWRGQMQLAPINEAGLTKDTREIPTGDSKLTIVDLRGNFQSGVMTPPFAGGAAAPPSTAPSSTAPQQSSQQESNALPAGHPPIAARQPAPSTAPFTFDLPEGWQSRPASGMRKVDLVVEDAGKAAVFTAIDFPADSPPMMSDPVANVRRWRGDVGLPPLSDDEIKQTMQPVEIDGTKATLVEVVPDESQPNADRATLAVMFTRGDAIWFLKLSGDHSVVTAQRDKFRSFLKSVRFTDSGGANDGNE